MHSNLFTQIQTHSYVHTNISVDVTTRVGRVAKAFAVAAADKCCHNKELAEAKTIENYILRHAPQFTYTSNNLHTIKYTVA